MDGQNYPYNQQAWPQPEQPWQPPVMQPAAPTGNKKIMIAIIFIVLVIAIGLISVAVLSLTGGNGSQGGGSGENNGNSSENGNSGNNGGNNNNSSKTSTITMESFTDFCNSNYYGVEYDLESKSSEFGEITQGVWCNGDKNNKISYYEFSQSVVDTDIAKEIREDADYLALIDESDTHLEFYVKKGGTYTYVILDGNTAFGAVIADIDDIEGILNGVRSGDARNSIFKEKKESEDIAISALEKAQRNTQRRNDIARVDVALVDYQTNNMGSLPPGPTIWTGASTFSGTCNTACNFVSLYLSTSKTTNDFIDPDGTPYSIAIAKNVGNLSSVAESDGVKPNVWSAKLVYDEEKGGLTIKDASVNKKAFDQHAIFIVPGGRCNNGVVIGANNTRRFAILYQLEDDGIYCLDDQ